MSKKLNKDTPEINSVDADLKDVLEDIARTEKGKGSLAEKIALTTLDKYK